MKGLFLFFAVFLTGCSLSALDTGGVERVKGTFYFAIMGDGIVQNSAHIWSVASACYFVLDEPRFIQYMHIQTSDPIKNLDVYTLLGKESWNLIKQIKSPIDATTRIVINRRAKEIRGVQKTVSQRKNDYITGFEVYAQKEDKQ